MPDISPCQKYQLLEQKDDFEGSTTSLSNLKTKANSRRIRFCMVICSVIATLSITFNLLFYIRVHHLSQELGKFESVGRSKFAGLEYKLDVPIYASTEYGPAIGTPADRDALWDALDMSPGVLAIPDDWADELGLPQSQRFPWDQSKGVYLLGVFHQIHCLKQIQKMTSEYHRGVEITVPYGHVEHCLDSILQEAFCHADDTPWYQLPPQPAADEYSLYQSRQCRSWDELLEWADSFNACYRYTNVTIRPGMSRQEEELEHYRFCPPGSPHAKVMEKYYEQREMR